jgi:hypothetical protein
MFKVYAINNKTKNVELYYLPIINFDIQSQLADMGASGPHRLDGAAVKGDRISRYYLGGIRYYSPFSFSQELERVEKMPLVERLLDPQQWIRDFKS